MAEPRIKRKKVMSLEAKEKKRERDKQFAKTRVNIGAAYTRWKELKEATKLQTDGDLALMLLDFYQTQRVASTPSKSMHSKPPQLAMSSITEDSNRHRNFKFEGVQPLDTQEEGVLEARIEIDEQWTNNKLRKDEDSCDEDCVPFLQICPGAADDTEQLHEIGRDEAVLDMDMPSAQVEDLLNTPGSHKGVCEDDLVGKDTSIDYHENLKTLTTYLHLPIQRCNNMNKITEVCCAELPFQVTMKPEETGVTNERTEAEDSSRDVPEIVAVLDEDSDSEATSEEFSDRGDVDSDDDWKPKTLNVDKVEEVFPVKMFRARPNDNSNKYIGYCDYLSLTPAHRQLCTDCGKFHDRRKAHTCEHKIKPYSCMICGKRCISEVALNFHSRIHNESYEHPCKYCNAVFKLKADKSIHEQLHMGEEKPFKCPECPMSFAKSRARKTHLEDHRGKVDLTCHICGLDFYSGLFLKRHLLVHTGEKPFKCSVCQRGFNQASHLKSHMRMHTGERPYKCKHCNKPFNHNVSLKTHVQRYHTDLESKEEAQKQVQGEDRDNEREILQSNKPKKRCTGRPIGRPKGFGSEKHSAENRAEGQMSNAGKRKYKWRRKKQLTEEDREDRLDSEEEWCRMSIKKPARSRKRAAVKMSGSAEEDPT